jgi:hypothetical protein
MPTLGEPQYQSQQHLKCSIASSPRDYSGRPGGQFDQKSIVLPQNQSSMSIVTSRTMRISVTNFLDMAIFSQSIATK